MIDLRPNCVAHLKMNDNAASPYIVNSLVGPPTELVQNNFFDVGASHWTLQAPWALEEGGAYGNVAYFNGAGSPAKYLFQNVGYVAGRKYVYANQIVDMYDQECRPYVGEQAGTQQTSEGSYAEKLTCGAGAGEASIWFGAPDAVFRIDNIFSFDLDAFPCTGVFRGAADGNPRTSAHTVAGKINRALSLDGTNDRIIVFDDGALEFPNDTDDFSIAIWFKRGRTGTEYLLDKRDAGGDGWSLSLRTVTNWVMFTLNAKFVWRQVAVNDTNRHLIIIVVDRDGNATLYLDNDGGGTPLDVSGQAMSITEPLHIGEDYTGGNRFQGDIDVTSFFNKALSSAERDMLWHGDEGTERLISAHHHIYCGQDGDIDYGTPAAEMALDDSQVTVDDQALPANTIWHYIRRQIDDECGLESDDSPACIVAIDLNGDMIGSTPNPPISLAIERLSNGRFRLRWRYTKLSEEVTPTGFKIYMDSGSGFNFSLPDATIAYGPGGINNEFSWTSGALTHGQIYRFCVRSYRTGEGESQNTDYVATDADSQGPVAITGLQVSCEEI